MDSISDSGCDFEAGNGGTVDGRNTDGWTAVGRLNNALGGLARLLIVSDGTESAVPLEKMGILLSNAGGGIERPAGTDNIGVPATEN